MKNLFFTSFSRIALALSFPLLSLSLQAQTFDADMLRKHIQYLASDELEGRLPGTEGEKLAAEYIEKQFRAYGTAPLGEDGYRQTFDYTYHTNPHDTVRAHGLPRQGTNIIAWLDNGAEKTVVIGGHYDHLGLGSSPNALDKDQGESIHNGADDNASGTAGVIELAGYLAGNGIREKSNYLFICFSAEEDGLIGSKYFTEHPTLDLSRISYMVNLDMIGRLNDSTQNLMIYGTGTSPIFETSLYRDTAGFNLVTDSAGIGPSDHTSFYLKDIPVLFFFTGQHADYHKSTDDTEKINFQGEVRVLEYVARLVMALDDEEKLAFTPVKTKQSGRTSFKVTLGVMPDYSFQGEGLKIDAVSEDKPAERAGILAGDIVIQMDTVVVHDIYDYMKCLGMFEAGDTVSVKLKRQNEELELKVQF